MEQKTIFRRVHSAKNKNAINEHIEFPRVYCNLKNF